MMFVKEFSRIVCVSLFSYQGFLSRDSFIRLPHLSTSVNNFFQVFLMFFQSLMRFPVVSVVSRDDLTTLPCIQSFVNKYFYFSETILNFHSFRNNLFLTAQLGYHKQPYLSTTFFHYSKNIFKTIHSTTLSCPNVPAS